jgi:hypothetical protein
MPRPSLGGKAWASVITTDRVLPLAFNHAEINPVFIPALGTHEAGRELILVVPTLCLS